VTRWRHAAAWAAGAVLLAWLPAQAQQLLSTSKHDTSLPIQISADAMQVEQNARTATFTGAVDVVQGDMRLTSDKLVVYYRDQAAADQNAIYKIDVDGNVHFATTTETASGDTGTYDVDKGVIELHGNVVLTSGDNVIRGNDATMNLETGQSQVSGGRVKAIVVPDKTNSSSQ
jgi:lipopolysaccharide export system protein LptA